MESVKKYSLLTCLWLFIYFYPAFQFILLVGFFVVADSITGVLAAIKTDNFTSRRFRSVVPKFIVFGLAVLISHVIQNEFFPDFPAMKLVAGLIAWGELVSIDENIKVITGKSLFKALIKKLQK